MKSNFLSLILIPIVVFLSSCRDNSEEYDSYAEEYVDKIDLHNLHMQITFMGIRESIQNEDFAAASNHVEEARIHVNGISSIVSLFEAIKMMESGNFEGAYSITSSMSEIWPLNVEYVMLNMLNRVKTGRIESVKEEIRSTEEYRLIPPYADVMLQTIVPDYKGLSSKSDLTPRQQDFVDKLEELNKISPTRGLTLP
jgi:hypothetical protein